MDLADIIKIATVATSCRERAKMLLIEGHYLDDFVFDALVSYTNNISETIDILTDLIENYYDDLESPRSIKNMEILRKKVGKSAQIEEILSKYVSLTVH